MRDHETVRTLIKQGATMEQTQIIICGITLEDTAWLAGAVVTKDADFALVVVTPPFYALGARTGEKFMFDIDHLQPIKKKQI
jgi:hypothetical protein